jgi:hypothetical protein
LSAKEIQLCEEGEEMEEGGEQSGDEVAKTTRVTDDETNVDRRSM